MTSVPNEPPKSRREPHPGIVEAYRLLLAWGRAELAERAAAAEAQAASDSAETVEDER